MNDTDEGFNKLIATMSIFCSYIQIGFYSFWGISLLCFNV